MKSLSTKHLFSHLNIIRSGNPELMDWHLKSKAKVTLHRRNIKLANKKY